MMMKKYNLYIILLICTLSSCSDFLEESSTRFDDTQIGEGLQGTVLR